MTECGCEVDSSWNANERKWAGVRIGEAAGAKGQQQYECSTDQI